MVEAVVPKALALRDLNRWKISKTGFAPWAARTVDSKSRLLSSRRWRPPTYAKQVLLASPQTPYRPTKEIKKRVTVSCSLFYGWGSRTEGVSLTGFEPLKNFKDGICALGGAHGWQQKPIAVKSAVETADLRKTSFACLPTNPVSPNQRNKKESNGKLLSFLWLRRRDLNPRPYGPEPYALPTALRLNTVDIIYLFWFSVKRFSCSFLN